MTVFVDTSALYALLDAKDRFHSEAANAWDVLARSSEDFITTNYIVIEISALVQNRLGMAAVSALHEDLLPSITIHRVTPEQHQESVRLMLATGRALSLVDCVSFAVMRDLSLVAAFGFDPDLEVQGFTPVTRM